MYADRCEECRERFQKRHYSWFVCLKCHKSLAENPEEYINRIKNCEDIR